MKTLVPLWRLTFLTEPRKILVFFVCDLFFFFSVSLDSFPNTNKLEFRNLLDWPLKLVLLQCSMIDHCVSGQLAQWASTKKDNEKDDCNYIKSIGHSERLLSGTVHIIQFIAWRWTCNVYASIDELVEPGTWCLDEQIKCKTIVMFKWDCVLDLVVG